MRESLKLQCRVDDVIDKEWRESETLNAEMITEALLLIVADLVDDIDDEDELALLAEMLEEVAGDIKSKVNDLVEELPPCLCKIRFKRCDPLREHEEEDNEDDDEEEETDEDEGVGPFLCKLHFKTKLSSKEGHKCTCCSK